MNCLFGHNYVETSRRSMRRISMLDLDGTVVPVIVFHCTKCGKRKVVEE